MVGTGVRSAEIAGCSTYAREVTYRVVGSFGAATGKRQQLCKLALNSTLTALLKTHKHKREQQNCQNRMDIQRNAHGKGFSLLASVVWASGLLGLGWPLGAAAGRREWERRLLGAAARWSRNAKIGWGPSLQNINSALFP